MSWECLPCILKVRQPCSYEHYVLSQVRGERISTLALVVKNPPAGDIRDAGSIPSWEGNTEKEMAAHSTVLAWRIPWREEPGGLHGVMTARPKRLSTHPLSSVTSSSQPRPTWPVTVVIIIQSTRTPSSCTLVKEEERGTFFGA